MTSVSDISQLEYTQSLRKKIISDLTTPSEPLDNPKKVRLILEVLRDMDEGTLGIMKIQADERSSEKNNNAAMIAQLLQAITVKDIQVIGEGSTTRVPVLPDELAEISLVPGELDTRDEKLSFKQFYPEEV